MSYLNQKTVKKPVHFSGIGLHTGNFIKICIKPSSPNSGIVFKRVDLKNNNLIYPNFSNVSDTFLNTMPNIKKSHYYVKISTGKNDYLNLDEVKFYFNNKELSRDKMTAWMDTRKGTRHVASKCLESNTTFCHSKNKKKGVKMDRNTHKYWCRIFKIFSESCK